MSLPNGVVRRVYLVRHGECYDNRAGLIARDNSRITPTGVDQAIALGRMFQPGAFSSVTVSPALRAVETANHIFHDSTVAGCLDEVRLGKWHGRPAGSFDEAKWIDDGDVITAEVETPGIVATRMMEHIRYVAGLGDAVIVSHRAPLTLGALWLLNWPFKCFLNMNMPVGSVSAIETDGESWKLVAWGLKP